MKRVFLIVLDSCGAGQMPDAHLFGDKDCHTIKRISSSEKFNADNLLKMGLGNIDGLEFLGNTDNPTAAVCKMTEKSMGKDTTIGHWEIAGVVSDSPLPTYPDGFPDDVDLFNLNVPSNYDSEEVKITHLSHKMLDKQVIDNTDEEKMEIFNYPLEDNQESDGLIMITPDLVKDYEEGSDGYALMVDRCPSLTPLKVNMTYDDLKNW